MSHGTRISAGLLTILLSCVSVNLSQAQSGEVGHASAESYRIFRILVSAQGIDGIPSGTLQWEGLDAACEDESGDQALIPTGPVSISLPVCKVRIMILVTGRDAQAVVVKLIDAEDGCNDSIHIALGTNGHAEVVCHEATAALGTPRDECAAGVMASNVLGACEAD